MYLTHYLTDLAERVIDSGCCFGHTLVRTYVRTYARPPAQGPPGTSAVPRCPTRQGSGQHRHRDKARRGGRGHVPSRFVVRRHPRLTSWHLRHPPAASGRQPKLE